MSDPRYDSEQGPCTDSPLSREWLAEIERRLNEANRNPGNATTWAVIREAAEARLSDLSKRSMHSSSNAALAFDVVAGAIRQWDPFGLLAGGAPEGEFDHEIQAIVKQIPRIGSERDAKYAISRVFSSAFDAETFKPDSCAVVGSLLYAALKLKQLI